MTLHRTGEEFQTRYSPGGDEFVFVQVDEAMSLESNLLVQRLTELVTDQSLTGVIDVCPANVSYMLRYDPELTSFDELVDKLTALEDQVRHEGHRTIQTRIVDLPILFGDPWTHEVIMKFRDRVQAPDKTDIEYLAELNGFSSETDFFTQFEESLGFVSMTGFIPGVLCTYALVERELQIEAPKYYSPRTETPERALGIGGTSRVIYPVPGAGGYPLIGRAAAPVYDPLQRLEDFADSPSFVRLADICSYRSIDMDEYEAIQHEVVEGTFRYTQKELQFEPDKIFADPLGYSSQLRKALYDD